ncbi:MAG TPA: phosphate ABC transporter ATP-binding protein [Planctomycetota bacterium]|nr:phosphate ABC transporter ATP-binding protein [Planctomycetota bacterium]
MPEPSTTHISVRNLSVHYGGQPALKNVSVNIPDRKITAVLGPSGCGKTTFLRCLNRLVDTVDGVSVSGQVLVDGEDLFDPAAEVTHIRKKMGLLSQRPYPLPMSIYDNVAYGPRIHGQSDRGELDALVEHHLKLAGLWDEVKGRLRAPATSLSIGQQQRLCLARGLAVGPEIILADEPTSALDPISSAHIEGKFKELRDQYTIVIVTHILRQARRLADYVIFMYMGELVEHGPAAEVFNAPREKQTREYISGVIS